MLTSLEQKVADYYTEKVNTHGNTHSGVDWNSKESQILRFNKLLHLIPANHSQFSILDYGCGYGALVELISDQYKGFEYLGYDISDKMLETARQNFNEPHIQWTNSLNSNLKVDYLIASGLFNVKLDFNPKRWRSYIIDTLHKFNSIATKGFSFNILSSYSDLEYQRNDLYYANPEWFFSFCKQSFSPFVSLIHDYPLYEFTIVVKKSTDQL